MFNDKFTKQFDELGLSIADLLYSDAECKKVYDEAIQHNLANDVNLCECIEHANYQVKVFVVERQSKLDAESFEYFNLRTCDPAFASWENVFKQSN